MCYYYPNENIDKRISFVIWAINYCLFLAQNTSVLGKCSSCNAAAAIQKGYSCAGKTSWATVNTLLKICYFSDRASKASEVEVVGDFSLSTLR
jgi:hypothetical protein